MKPGIIEKAAQLIIVLSIVLTILIIVAIVPLRFTTQILVGILSTGALILLIYGACAGLGLYKKGIGILADTTLPENDEEREKAEK